MTDAPTCLHQPDPDWDYYTCSGIAAVGEGSDHAWLIAFDPPKKAMCDEIDQFRILQDDEDAEAFALYGIKFGVSPVEGSGWRYAIQVQDRNVDAPSRAPLVRCRFAWRKTRNPA